MVGRPLTPRERPKGDRPREQGGTGPERGVGPAAGDGGDEGGGPRWPPPWLDIVNGGPTVSAPLSAGGWGQSGALVLWDLDRRSWGSGLA